MIQHEKWDLKTSEISSYNITFHVILLTQLAYLAVAKGFRPPSRKSCPPRRGAADRG